MRDIDQVISNVILILADVSERFQPMSKEQRAIVEAVRILQKIDCRAASVITEVTMQAQTSGT